MNFWCISVSKKWTTKKWLFKGGRSRHDLCIIRESFINKLRSYLLYSTFTYHLYISIHNSTVTTYVRQLIFYISNHHTLPRLKNKLKKFFDVQIPSVLKRNWRTLYPFILVLKLLGSVYLKLPQPYDDSKKRSRELQCEFLSTDTPYQSSDISLSSYKPHSVSRKISILFRYLRVYTVRVQSLPSCFHL